MSELTDKLRERLKLPIYMNLVDRKRFSRHQRYGTGGPSELPSFFRIPKPMDYSMGAFGTGVPLDVGPTTIEFRLECYQVVKDDKGNPYIVAVYRELFK